VCNFSKKLTKEGSEGNLGFPQSYREGSGFTFASVFFKRTREPWVSTKGTKGALEK
jgi:hypothetical protein